MSERYFTIPYLSTKEIARFFSKIQISQDNVYNGIPCWEWTRYISPEGYGEHWYQNNKTLSHRFVYAWLVGPLPKKRYTLELDHLCRNRKCCNPAHLDLVTHKENMHRGHGVAGINVRKTTCNYGHPLVQRKRSRYCRECARLNYHKKKAADPEYIPKILERVSRRHAERMMSDPEYAARQRAYKRAARMRLKQDPERHAKDLAYRREWKQRRKASKRQHLDEG